jgi:hypothetical protein
MEHGNLTEEPLSQYRQANRGGRRYETADR